MTGREDTGKMVQVTELLQQQWAAWGIGVLLGVVLLWLCLRALKRYRIRQRRARLDPRKMTIADIDNMEGAEFERYLQRLFTELGYADAEKTKDSSDFGADLVFTDRLGVRNVLQAKRYAAGQAIGLDAVQEVYTSVRYYDAERAIVLTTAGRFTASCVMLAGVNEVCLLGRDELIQIIRYFKSGRHDQAMDMIEREAEHLLSPWQQA